ncbi:MAG: hypothetical protein RIB61_14185 [Roseicyclus sp.]|jgi:hypothetical protein
MHENPSEDVGRAMPGKRDGVDRFAIIARNVMVWGSVIVSFGIMNLLASIIR